MYPVIEIGEVSIMYMRLNHDSLGCVFRNILVDITPVIFFIFAPEVKPFFYSAFRESSRRVKLSTNVQRWFHAISSSILNTISSSMKPKISPFTYIYYFDAGQHKLKIAGLK